ncbi:MAG: cupin domain-containing protein [Candidatus Eremiobacteraeota bacterium]|nr:cupin domain-containing protein [Candidatus Eremiobacteraeota bacterium]
MKPDDLKWSAMEGMPGAQMAVVYGNPAAAGTYTLRLKLAPGTKFPAHWHPSAERVTILSGTFLVGVGDKMDVSHMQALPAGSFVYLPAGFHHYAMAKTAVVLQSTGMGPFKMNVVK